MRIRIAALAGTAGMLTAAIIAASAGATFNGGNGPIAFQSDRTGNAEIFTMTAAGGSQTNRSSNSASDTDPNWSQDRTKIVFVSNRDGDNEIFTMNADGSGQTQITTDAGSDTDPAFSPDNSTIVFASDRDGDREIYTVPAGGGSVTKLTNNAVQDFAPDWAEAGGKIAFQRFTGGVGPGTGDEIFSMNTDGTGQTNLTNNAGTISDRNPSWKPDGTRIAFESNRDGDYEIFRMQAGGATQTQLTNSSAADVQAAYSPDGTKIAFSSTRTGNAEIFAMGETGAGPTNVSNNAGADTAPSWQALDIFPPDTTITAGSTEGTTINDASPTFEFTSTEAGSTFECRFDADAFTACTSPFTASPDLTEGAHTFEVRAIDPSGNTDPTPASRSFTVDTTIDTTITAGPADGSATNDTTPTFEFDAGEPATFECQVDGSGFAPCDTPFTTEELSEGSHTFEVRATDTVGNVDPTPALRTFTVDTTEPETTIDTGPADGGLTSTATPTFTFSSDEAGTFECSVDNSTFASCASPFTTDPLSDGSHTFAVRATDQAGNTDSTPAQRTFTVDTTPPDTTITAGPDEGSTIDDRTPTVEFNSDDPGATFECAVDGGAPAACTSPFTFDELDDGLHDIAVTAIDAAGNPDPTPATRSFTVDAPPRTTIDTGVADGGFTNDTTPEFTFSSDEDPDTTFECSVDGSAFTACTSPFATDPLADDPHTFSVRALDLSSRPDPSPPTRTFTVDTAAPETSFTAGPADGATINDTTPTYEVTSDQANSTFECSVDGGPFDPCTSPYTTAALTEATHTIEVRATDPAGNTDPTPASRTVTIDLTPPDTQHDFGPADGSIINDSTPSFGFSSPDDPTATFECSVDGSAFTACTSGFTTDPLTDGPHTFAVRAVDPSGNADPSPSTKSFTVDTVEPVTTIDTGVADGGFTNDPTPEFSFSSSEPGGTFQCSVDGEPYALCTSPFTTTNLADGTHTFQVYAVDQAGNVDQSPASRSFTVDTDEPETTIDSGPADPTPTDDRTPTFEFSSDEPGSTFECNLDGGGFNPCTSPLTTGELIDGPHTLEVRATDAAGNTDSSPAQRNFTVDAAPDTTIDTGPAQGALINDTTPTFTFSSDDITDTYECDVDGGGFQPCTSPFTTDPLDDGSHTFSVRATDTTAHTDQTPATRTFTVDATAPIVTIDSGPLDPTNQTTADFTFSSNEPGTTFTCSLDSGPADPCTSPQQYTGLLEGPHDLEVVGTDLAGNPSIPVIYDWVIDLTAPDTTIDNGPAEASTIDDRTPTFEFSSTEPGSTFQCSVDGGAPASCTSPFTTAELDDGPHTFSVTATDAAGNPDPSAATRSFTLDAAPRTTITAGPANGAFINDPSPTFEFTSDEDPDATFECEIDGGGFNACTSPFTVSPDLGDGPHTFSVRALDLSLRPDPTPPTRSFTVDTDLPETTIDTGVADGATTGDPTPTFTFSTDEPTDATFECSVNGGAFTSCTSPFTTGNLTDGSNTFAVRATDRAGNTDGSPASRTFTVDTTPPDTSFTAGPADGATTGDNTPTYEFTSTEPGSTFECSVDGGAFTGCTSPFTAGTLADGSHTVAVRATDAVGNTDGSPVQRTVIVDTGPPDTSITSGPADGSSTNDTTPTFAFSSPDNTATFECSVDGGAFTACTSPVTTAVLADGARTFAVRARDAVGNVDATPATRAFTVDTAPPDTAITSGPADGSTITTNIATFGFNSPDGGTTFQCSLDGGAFSACTSPATTTALGAGSHTFRVRSTDAAGNTDASPAARTFVVQGSPQTQTQPVVRQATSPGGKVKAKKGKVSLTLSCPSDATTPCTGTVSLGKNGKGSVPYSIQPGQAVKVSLKLSKKAKRKLGKKGSAKLTLTITGSNGQKTTVAYKAKQGSTGKAK